MNTETRLVLKDGTVYVNGECGYVDGKLWCWMKDTTFQKVFLDFSDPSKTEEIHFIRFDKEIIYFGFTDVDVIRRTEYEIGKYTIDVRLVGENVRYEEFPIIKDSEEDVNTDGSN